MKRAFFILGAEASGTMLLTDAIRSAGVYGDSGHRQRLDSLEFADAPNEIVFRRTCPHGDGWPNIVDLATKLITSGYRVEPILTIRNVIMNIESQVRRGHAATHRIAHDSINHANELIYSQLAEIGLYPMVVSFEAFVRREEVRKSFFRLLGLADPTIHFHDSPAKYRTGQDPIILSH